MKENEKVKEIGGLPNKNTAAIFNVQQTGMNDFNFCYQLNKVLFYLYHKLTGILCPNWCLIFTGYYRVNYDEENWKLIIKQLNEDHTQIHVINRAQIIDDAINLARVGLLKYELALGVTSYLNSETEYIPWAAALTGFRYLEEMLKRTAAYGDFKVSFGH